MRNMQQYVDIDYPIDQSLTASALIVTGHILDCADNEQHVTLRPEEIGSDNIRDVAFAWMEAALLIADMHEVDTVTLHSLANKIFKGVQGVL